MRRKNQPLPQWKTDYILAHVNDRPRAKVARDAGVSLNTVYRIVREAGGEMLYGRTRRNAEWVRIVKENYATMAGHEIERKYGITRNRANKIARDLGLRHTQETEERIRREAAERLIASRGHVDERKRRWKLTRRMDELRVLSGQPQQTGFKFKSITRRAYAAKWYLCHRYGYYECEGEPYTLLYDGRTRRRPERGAVASEEYYARKYKLKFERI